MIIDSKKPRLPSSPLSPFADDQMIKAFAGLLEKWPNCPLCGGRFGFTDYSGLPITMNKDFRVACLKNKHFSATVKHTASTFKNEKYIKKKATFTINLTGGYYIVWESTKPDKVGISFPTGKFDFRFLEINFGTLDKWFLPEQQLKESLDRYRILL